MLNRWFNIGTRESMCVCACLRVWVGKYVYTCVVEMTMTRSMLVNICAIKVVHYIHCKAVTLLLGYVIMGGGSL